MRTKWSRHLNLPTVHHYVHPQSPIHEPPPYISLTPVNPHMTHTVIPPKMTWTLDLFTWLGQYSKHCLSPRLSQRSTVGLCRCMNVCLITDRGTVRVNFSLSVQLSVCLHWCPLYLYMLMCTFICVAILCWWTNVCFSMCSVCMWNNRTFIFAVCVSEDAECLGLPSPWVIHWCNHRNYMGI